MAELEERRGLRRRISVLIWQADTLPTRFSLAFAATLLAGSTWAARDDCTYIGCSYLSAIMPWQAWAVAWSIYAPLKWWRVFDGAHRHSLALLINTFGAFLFCAAAIALTLARWPFVILSSASIVLACASGWVLMRTGVNAGLGFKGD